MTPPPFITEDSFDERCYETATLHVPVSAVEGYRNAPVWNRFVHIQAIDILPGDVDGDGEVTIGDANSVIDVVIMGGNNGHTRIPAADVNGDGEVSIADVNAIIDIILKND